MQVNFEESLLKVYIVIINDLMFINLSKVSKKF